MVFAPHLIRTHPTLRSFICHSVRSPYTILQFPGTSPKALSFIFVFHTHPLTMRLVAVYFVLDTLSQALCVVIPESVTPVREREPVTPVRERVGRRPLGVVHRPAQHFVANREDSIVTTPKAQHPKPYGTQLTPEKSKKFQGSVLTPRPPSNPPPERRLLSNRRRLVRRME